MGEFHNSVLKECADIQLKSWAKGNHLLKGRETIRAFGNPLVLKRQSGSCRGRKLSPIGQSLFLAILLKSKAVKDRKEAKKLGRNFLKSSVEFLAVPGNQGVKD